MKIDKNRKLKGSVLLTVVAVMALLIIFMASTVTLATAANNRSHANYSDSQAEYTARAAIEGFSQALTLNDDLANGVLAMNNIGDTFTPSVVINNPGMGNVGYYEGKNWVPDKIKIEYIKDNMGYDKDKDCWEPMQVIKITATAKVGKQEKSLCCYLERSGESSDTQNNSIKGFQTLGGGGMQNNGSFSGALCLGLGNPDVDPNTGKPYLYGTRNDFGASITDGFVNGAQYQSDGDRFVWNVPSSDSHYVVTKDWGLKNSGLVINVNYPYSKANNSGVFVDTQFTQKDIPYLYVGGTIGPNKMLGVTNDTKAVLTVNNSVEDNIRGKYYRAPFNIFAGAIDLSTVKLEGTDLYLFDPDTDKVSYPCGGVYSETGDGTKLYKWSSSVLNKTEAQFRSEGGSIYCNHNLYVKSQPLTVEGNLVVQGDLTANQDITVKGDLVVNGKISDMSKITCYGNIYYNGDASAVETNNVYVKRNAPAEGGLKPNVKKVENKAYGGIYVPSVVVTNIPRYAEGDISTIEIKESKNSVADGYTLLNLVNSGGWKDENGKLVTFAADPGNQNYFNNSILNDYEKYKIKKENVDGVEVATAFVKYNDAGEITDITGECDYIDMLGNRVKTPVTYYYEFNDQKVILSEKDGDSIVVDKEGNVVDANKTVELLQAGPDGKPVSPEVITTSAVTKYKVILKKDDSGNMVPEVTNIVTDNDGTYFKVNYMGEPTDIEIVDSSVGVYYKVDPATDTVKNEEATTPYSYYLKTDDTYTEISETDAYGEAVANTYYAWYDPTKITLEKQFYYKADPSGHEGDETWHNNNVMTEADVLSSGKKVKYRPIATYSGATELAPGIYTVYPKNMTWAGLNSGSTKIVKQLDEAIRDIGGDPKITRNGDPSEDTYQWVVPDGSYNSNFDITSISNVVDVSTISSGEYVIDRDIVLKGSTTNKITFKVKAKSNMFIVLDGTNFGAFAAFVVEGKDTVNFLLKDTVSFRGEENNNVNSGIYTKKIYDQLFTAGKKQSVIRINETDKMNINMYGKKKSKLFVDNGGNMLFCACAKCPFTELLMEKPGGIGPSGGWQYVDNYNHIQSIPAVSWIGSGLFKSAPALSNNFQLIYTNSSDDNTSNLHNNNVAGASWRIKYYDGY